MGVTGQSATALGTPSGEAILPARDAAVHISYTISPTETTDVARLGISWAVDEAIRSFKHDYDPSALTLVDSSDLDTSSSGTFRWERETMGDTPTATVEYEANQRPQRFAESGPSFAVTDDWGFVSIPEQSLGGISVRHGPDLETKQVTRSLSAGDTGTAGSQYVYLGEYDDIETNIDGESIRLVVPGHVTVDSSALLARLARVSDRLAIGGRVTEATAEDAMIYDDSDPKITGFVVSDPIRKGGQARGADFYVHEAATAETDIVPLHEYVHTRQRYRAASTLTWTIEASAEYFAGRLNWLDGLTSYENFRELLLQPGETHPDVVLAESQTWSGTRADYEKGALVLAALDAKIQATGNQETLETVFERLNAAAVNETATSRAVRTNQSPPADRSAESHTAVEQLIDAGQASIVQPEKMTGRRLQTIAEEVAGTDLTEFFESYVRGRETPPVPAADELLQLSAGFSVESADLGVETAITLEADVSTPAPGDSIDRYEWTLGDGTIKTGQQVSHTYETAGEYSVTLEVSSGKKLARHTEVIPRLAVGIETNEPGDDGFRVGDEIRVTASVTPSTSVDRYEWDFDDGTTLTEPVARHTYADPGEYDIELEAVTETGTATAVTRVSVQPVSDTTTDSNQASEATDEEITDETAGFGVATALGALSGATYLIRRRLGGESQRSESE